MSFKDQHTWVICAYGESHYLENCILSLKNQTVKSQIICYTSTLLPSIEDLCKKYNIPLFHKVGGGIGKDWNNALSFVESQYTTIAHQDDYYEPTYLEKIANKIGGKEQWSIAFSDYFEEKKGTVIPANANLKIKSLMLRTMAIFPSSKWWKKRILAFGNPICCPAVTYNLSALKDFQFDEKMRVSLDWYAWYKINQYPGQFVYVPEKLMCHRIHEESETSKTISDNTRTVEDQMMYEKFWPKWIADLLMKQYVKSQKTNN